MSHIFTRRLLHSFLLALPFIFVLSCQREIDFDPSLTPPVPKNMTVEGVITNEAGLPLKEVTIKAGNVQVTTDLNGSFRAINVTMTSGEAFITATKNGYFTGSRTFFPREGSNNFVRIQLLERKEAASLNGATGGTAIVGGARIFFLPIVL